MEAKDFELPIDGSLSKLVSLHTQQEKPPNSSLAAPKEPNKDKPKDKNTSGKKKK